jgi:hypothetical protein
MATESGRQSIDSRGRVSEIAVTFGPHYRIEVAVVGDRVKFRLVATHHGFEADATEVGGQLERFIEHIRDSFPDSAID